MKLFLPYRSFTCTPLACSYMQIVACSYMQLVATHALTCSASLLLQIRLKKKSVHPAGFEPTTHRNLWNLTAML